MHLAAELRTTRQYELPSLGRVSRSVHVIARLWMIKIMGRMESVRDMTAEHFAAEQVLVGDADRRALPSSLALDRGACSIYTKHLSQGR